MTFMYCGHLDMAIFLKRAFSPIEPCRATTAMALAKKSIRNRAIPARPFVADPTVQAVMSDAAAPIPIGMRNLPFMPKNWTLLSSDL